MIVFRILACVTMQAIYVGLAAIFSWLADVGLALFSRSHDLCGVCLRRERICRDAFDAIDRKLKAER